jgi:hypothetical protein
VDEPVLYIREGANVLHLPLSEVLWIYQEAETLARAVMAKTDGAAETAQAIRQASGARAELGAYLLDVALAGIERDKIARAIPTTATVVAGDSKASPAAGTAPPGSAAGGACAHPPDVACPNCASAHQEARNARKRSGRAA